MGALNIFTAIGRPISNIISGQTAKDKLTYCTFMFAIPNPTSIRNGQPTLVNPDDIIQCRAYKDVARVLIQHLNKGEMVCLTGRIKYDPINKRHYFWVRSPIFLSNYFKPKGSAGREFYREWEEDEKGNKVLTRIGDRPVKVEYLDEEEVKVNEDGEVIKGNESS